MFWQNAYAGTIGLPQASTIAHRVDSLHDFLFWMSLFFTVLVTVLMAYFVMKYHRSKKGRMTEYILDNHKLEFTWTVVPLILMLFIFGWGYRDYLALRAEQAPDVEVNVLGRQWMWNFEYANGKKTLNELYLPKDRNIKLIMTSEDVLHDFFIPDFRMKQDVVPGMYTALNFRINEGGVHAVYCAEFCGTGHSDMLANVIVLESKDYDNWMINGRVPAYAQTALQNAKKSANPIVNVSADHSAAKQGTQQTPAEKGKELVQAKGCFACHAMDGTTKIGPSFAKLFGTKVQLADGKEVLADENYIRESVMEPTAKIVKGFAPSMPTFKGQINDEEMNAIIAYIKSLK